MNEGAKSSVPRSAREKIAAARRKNRRKKYVKQITSAATVIGLLVGIAADALDVRSTVVGWFSHSDSALNKLSKNLSVSNTLGLQTTLNFAEDAHGKPDHARISWSLDLLISNAGTTPIAISDVEPKFPMAKFGPKEQPAILRKATTNQIFAFRDLKDFAKAAKAGTDADPGTELIGAPAVIPAGGEKVLKFDQEYTFDVGDKPIKFQGGVDFIDTLGQYLQLERDDGKSDGYLCGDKLVDMTINTQIGDLTKRVRVELIPQGCEFKINPPS